MVAENGMAFIGAFAKKFVSIISWRLASILFGTIPLFRNKLPVVPRDQTPIPP